MNDATTIMVHINKEIYTFNNSESFKTHLIDKKDSIMYVNIQRGDVILTNPVELFKDSIIQSFETKENIYLWGDCTGMFQNATST